MPPRADDLVTTDVSVALDRIRAGGLVAIPTETVYGLAADAENPDAVARIYAVKGRPTDHPLIVHVADVDHLDGWVGTLDDGLDNELLLLASTCWPGPLTMLLPRGPRVGDWVTGGRPTVGVRAPFHPLTQDLLVRFDGGLAAPSANRFGKVSPTTAGHVLDDLAGLLEPGRDAVLDGGPCHIGVESTIVDMSVSPPQVLRAGAIDHDQITRLLERPLADASGPSRASGMLAAHYEPECRVVLAETATEGRRIAVDERARGRTVDLVDRTSDPVAAAQLLYSDLRAADAQRLDTLVVVLPPPSGLGLAIRDRLMKAAAGGARRSSNPGR
jgi:L-threonylcarbamoyladenylate synthase